MTDDHMTDDHVAELVELMREAASAYIGGDIRHYFDLMQESDDYTLMDPFGTIQRHTPVTDARIAELEELVVASHLGVPPGGRGVAPRAPPRRPDRAPHHVRPGRGARPRVTTRW